MKDFLLKLGSLTFSAVILTEIIFINVFQGWDVSGYICIPILGLLLISNIAMTINSGILLNNHIKKLESDKERLREMEDYASYEAFMLMKGGK